MNIETLINQIEDLLQAIEDNQELVLDEKDIIQNIVDYANIKDKVERLKETIS